MRVKVWNGDQSRYLGEGELLGYVTVYAWYSSDGLIVTDQDAEALPRTDMIEQFGEPYRFDNPKIKLDTDQIVYGCQVWWKDAND